MVHYNLLRVYCEIVNTLKAVNAVKTFMSAYELMSLELQARLGKQGFYWEDTQQVCHDLVSSPEETRSI